MIYRSISRNISKRRYENRIYLNIKKKILSPFKSFKRNIKDKNYIYRKCKKCKKVLRLPIPYKRGIKHVKCPKCGNKLTVLVLRKEKIEVIRKKS